MLFTYHLIMKRKKLFGQSSQFFSKLKIALYRVASDEADGIKIIKARSIYHVVAYFERTEEKRCNAVD